jgi:carboxylesterase type B
VRNIGNPNTPKLPHWPAFTTKDRETMVINNQSNAEKDPLREQGIAMFAALTTAKIGSVAESGEQAWQ